jgi:hypothetical protein
MELNLTSGVACVGLLAAAELLDHIRDAIPRKAPSPPPTTVLAAFSASMAH